MADYSIQYTYQRSGAGPPGAAVLNNTLSHHHMLSFPRIYALGAIVMASAAIKGDCNGFTTRLQRYYGAAIPTLAPKDLPKVIGHTISYPEDNNSLHQVLTTIGWTSDNLFIGPSGVYRSDDPSQGNDTRPDSMSSWAFPETVINIFQNAGISVPNVSGTGGTYHAIRLRDNQIHDIANKFLGAISKITPRLRETIVSDWVAQIDDPRRSGRYRSQCYPIFFASSSGGQTQSNDAKLLCAKLKVRQRQDSVSHTQVFRICCRTYAGSNSYLYGELVNSGTEHQQQGTKGIINLMSGVPLKK